MFSLLVFWGVVPQPDESSRFLSSQFLPWLNCDLTPDSREDLLNNSYSCPFIKNFWHGQVNIWKNCQLSDIPHYVICSSTALGLKSCSCSKENVNRSNVSSRILHSVCLQDPILALGIHSCSRDDPQSTTVNQVLKFHSSECICICIYWSCLICIHFCVGLSSDLCDILSEVI